MAARAQRRRVLADAAPRLPEREYAVGDVMYRRSPSNDPLGELSREVRDIREGHDHNGADRDEGGSVWQYGPLFALFLAAGAICVTATRLRTPLYRVPKGVRVA